MDKEAKKLKVIEIKGTIKANALGMAFIIGIFGVMFSIFGAIVLNPVFLVGVILFIALAIWEYSFIMEKGIKAVKKQYKDILKFD